MSKSQRQNSVASNVSATSDVNSVIRGLDYIESKYKISAIVSNLVEKMVDDSNLSNDVLKELVKNLKGNYATNVTICKSVIAARTEIQKANLKKEKESKPKAVAKVSTKGSTNATTYKGGRSTRPPQVNNRLLSSEDSEDSDVSNVSNVDSKASSTKNSKHTKPSNNSNTSQSIPQIFNLTSDDEKNTSDDEENSSVNNTISKVNTKTGKPRRVSNTNPQQLNSDEKNPLAHNTRSKVNTLANNTKSNHNNQPPNFNNGNISSEDC